mgnify:CR=1 FL=1
MDLFGRDKGAVMSDCGAYRYALWRTWEPTKPHCLFIGLNPSTADAEIDDPTIRRCISFSTRWGFGGLKMVNLFAVRATDPKDMMAHPRPIGAANDQTLREAAAEAGVIVCAWGVGGGFLQRDSVLVEMLRQYPLHCLGRTRDGKPRHPLYIRSDKELEPFP